MPAPPSPPPLPPGDRPLSLRPQLGGHHGFVRDTVHRLADDAAKMGPVLPAASATAPLPYTARSGGTAPLGALDDMVATAMADAGLWRRSFQIEAAECVRGLQAVFDSANATHFASRFEDWRKVDLKATAQMQQHVKQLAQLNRAIEEFLTRCATPDEFVNFKGSLVAMTHCVDELSTTRRELAATVDVIAERAAIKALAAAQVDLNDFSAKLSEHMDTQRARWTHEDAREQIMDTHMETMRGQVEQLGAQVQHQGDQVARLEETHKQKSDEVVETLRDATRSLLDATQTTAEATKEQLCNTFREVAEEDLQSLKGLLSDMLIGPGTGAAAAAAADGKPAGAKLPSVAQAIGSLDRRLHEWEAAHVETNNALQAAVAISMSNAMRRLKEIEGRGHLTINRHSGELKLVKPIEFAGAAFGDAAQAAKSLSDVAELLLIYRVPVELQVFVKVTKGKPKAECEQLATSRAELVKGQLEELQVPGDLLALKGATGPQEGLVVQLDKDLFVEAPQQPAKSGGGRSGSPSRGKR